MALLIYDLLSVVGVLFCAALIVYFWNNRNVLFLTPPIYANGKWCLPLEVSAHNLGSVEGNNPLLKEVFVVANKIDEPQNGLLKAVKKNFKKCISYSFFISVNECKSEIKKHVRVFEGYANAVCPDNDASLVSAHCLTIKWHDVPYIFYSCKKSDESEETFIFGYRGSQLSEGIADNYTLLGPMQAYTIFNLITGYDSEKVMPLAEVDSFSVGNVDRISAEKNIAEVEMQGPPLQ